MGHVYYHYPEDKQFSLDFVNADPADVVTRIVEYDDEVAVKVREYTLDEAFYVVYTSRGDRGVVKYLDFDLSDALERMDPDNGVIVTRLLEIYRALLSQNEEEEGTPVEAYKNIDIDVFPDTLDEVSWDGSATDVAGRLASNLILKHALPNANHRTAVAMMQFYLRRINLDFSMPETAVESETESYDWRDWVNEYIEESKRLLTVRRKNVPFKHLREFGETTLERKHGVLIDLTEYELDMYPHEAKEKYAREHEQLWIEFVEEAVERAGYPEMKNASALSKAEFAERIWQLE
jgi:hypothetical protein